MSRSRNWCFTINNYTEEDVSALADLPCKYMVYGKEVGESGTPHLQGYVVFATQRTLSATRKKIRGHLSPAKGDAQQNYDYCTKDGDYVERGTKPLSNKDKGLKEKERYKKAFQAAKEGRLDDIPEDMRTRHYSTYKAIMRDHMPDVDDADDVTGDWFWGPAGAGKSRTARQIYPKAYLKPCNKWWDGYQNQDYVIIDDVDTKHDVLGHHFKIWADRYAFIAENKGGAIKIRPKRIIITSQYPPESIWSDTETLAAIRRRFKITHFTGQLTRS